MVTFTTFCSYVITQDGTGGRTELIAQRNPLWRGPHTNAWLLNALAQ